MRRVSLTYPRVSLEEFQERDSNWILSRILNLTLNVNKYKYRCMQVVTLSYRERERKQ